MESPQTTPYPHTFDLQPHRTSTHRPTPSHTVFPRFTIPQLLCGSRVQSPHPAPPPMAQSRTKSRKDPCSCSLYVSPAKNKNAESCRDKTPNGYHGGENRIGADNMSNIPQAPFIGQTLNNGATVLAVHKQEPRNPDCHGYLIVAHWDSQPSAKFVVWSYNAEVYGDACAGCYRTSLESAMQRFEERKARQ